MWRSTLIALAFLLLCPFAFSQSTTVSGTIIDGGGQAWFAGTYSFVFLPNPSNPGAVYTWSGGAFSKTLTGQLNGSGAYSASIPSNNAISPQGSSWSVTFCPQASSTCTTPVPLSLVSPTLTFSPTPPIILINMFTAVPPISAYTDSEITGTIVGSTYYNLTLTQIRICMTVSGNSCGVWAAAAVASATNLTGPGAITGTFSGSPTLTGGWTFANVTDSALTAGNCVQAGTAGLLATTASPCSNVSTTGSPVSGNLTKFSGGSTITNGDLSGDISTSGSLVTTLPNIATAGTNTKITFNAKGQVMSAASAQLASADYVNQGTVHTVLHGNALGNPSFGQVDLTTEVVNNLPSAQLGASTGNCTGTNFAQGWNAGGTPICASAPSGAAAVNLTAQQADITATTFFTPAANGFYRFSCYLVVTQRATTSSTLPGCFVQWTDGDTSTAAEQLNVTTGSVVANPTVGLIGNAVSSGLAWPSLFVKGGTAVQYFTQGYASVGATPMQFALHIRLEGPI